MPLRCPRRRKLRFLSTLSLRRATRQFPPTRQRSRYFYPRSPCGERHLAEPRLQQHQYFYPRSPCGERRSRCRSCGCRTKFLSTLSLRRATPAPSRQRPATDHFYPRSPCGERLPFFYRQGLYLYISIHALLAESDRIIKT